MRLIYRWICVAIGAVLGSGCSDNPTDPVEYGPVPMPEYGVPTGTIVLDGRVLDGRGAGIPGIEVVFNGGVADTTDATGAWSIDADHVFIPCAGGHANSCEVTANDIDGPDNGGHYPSVKVVLDPDQTDPGDGGSDQGTWEQHGVDIAMDIAVEYGPPVAKVEPSDTPRRPAR